MSDTEGYEVARITIVRTVTNDDDKVTTDWTEGTGLIELLGMIEYGRDHVLCSHPDRFIAIDEDEDDD